MMCKIQKNITTKYVFGLQISDLKNSHELTVKQYTNPLMQKISLDNNLAFPLQ